MCEECHATLLIGSRPDGGLLDEHVQFMTSMQTYVRVACRLLMSV